jgi:hypothetical protein
MAVPPHNREGDSLSVRMQARAVELEAQRAAMTPEQRRAEHLAVRRCRDRLRDLGLLGLSPFVASIVGGRRRPRVRGAGRPRARVRARSSCRSGDSGDSSEPGEPEPPQGGAHPNLGATIGYIAEADPIGYIAMDAMLRASALATWRANARDRHTGSRR